MSDAKQADPQPRARINPPVFYASAILALAFVLYAVVFTESAAWLFTSIHEWVTHSAGWFYILSVAFFLVLVVVMALTDFGRIKLGPDHSEPDYSYGSWFAMLFSAGMGIGLMFFGVAEPIMHYLSPPA